MVPGGGFEPPTRGFSVHCSTPELPGRPDTKPLARVFYCLTSGLSRGIFAEIQKFSGSVICFVIGHPRTLLLLREKLSILIP